VPQLAMAEHKKNIDISVDAALKAAGLSSVESVDAVAVTKGPGLEVCLRVGMRKAQVEYFPPSLF
jgi:N6-L-threonylcarbamoyladenine synthase